MSKILVQNWLEKLANTANEGNIDAHLELISEKINVLDEPGQRNLDYTELAESRRHRFQADTPVHISYRDMRIKTMTPARVKFVATETVEQPDRVNKRGKEFIIQREDDGCWRAVEERCIPGPDASR